MSRISRKAPREVSKFVEDEEVEETEISLEEELMLKEAMAKTMQRYLLYDPNNKGYVTKSELRKVMQGGTSGSPNAKFASEVSVPSATMRSSTPLLLMHHC